MLRKVFGGAMLFSVTGAIVFGGAFAWKVSDDATGSSTVGEQAIEVQYAANSQLLGPNGKERKVGAGGIDNTGDFNVKVMGGTMSIESVAPNDGLCLVTHFEGRVETLGLVVIPAGQAILGDAEFNGHIKVLETAPATCMNKVVSYKIVINAQNDPADSSAP